MSGTNSHQHLRYHPSQMYHLADTASPTTHHPTINTNNAGLPPRRSPPPSQPSGTTPGRASGPGESAPAVGENAETPTAADPKAQLQPGSGAVRLFLRLSPSPSARGRHQNATGTPWEAPRNEENAAMNKSPAAPPPVRLWRWSTSFLTSLASTYTPPHPTDLHNTHSPSQ